MTGHTGFKGSWLCLLLKKMGANVYGLSLPPYTNPNHMDLLDMDIVSYTQDIQDPNAVSKIVQSISPQIIFHMAAQPLVRLSYEEPLLTWNTNVMGTLHVLESSKSLTELEAIVVVTTDKCYENREIDHGYSEEEPLGGHDPYSSSKAATELLVASYRNSFFSSNSKVSIASARAGNVIGGGDWSLDRLVPDLVRACEGGNLLKIRFPQSTRPWQHVLDSLYGYLLLAQKLIESGSDFAQAWNFGPEKTSNVSVQKLLEKFKMHWPKLTWEVESQQELHEAKLLYLNSNKANNILGWKPVLDFEETVEITAKWYQEYYESGTIISHKQISDYLSRLAIHQG